VIKCLPYGEDFVKIGPVDPEVAVLKNLFLKKNKSNASRTYIPRVVHSARSKLVPKPTPKTQNERYASTPTSFSAQSETANLYEQSASIRIAIFLVLCAIRLYVVDVSIVRSQSVMKRVKCKLLSSGARCAADVTLPRVVDVV